MKDIKSFIKEASFSDLEKAKVLIEAALNERQAQETAKQEVLALLKEKGLTLDDLVENNSADKRAKVQAKYRITRDGETFEWSGRGKRPKAFEGVLLEQYLAN
ncbi:H-NS family nucleoid-associated regulatory protein [Pseudoalteromonas tunicata]|jgi:DNA-binding protein H-NS|uniref:Probable trans-acting regulatory HvrA protein n=1 Tax=Pseudoalteromonas tunicata D2 TaxID=87626 RepID=A4C5L2_9GAMM|nr:H-NS family nucleoid-associated regulatory protein [Pseudoalteromonas tunicata]ATC95240.1 hypothetical protein PTUN_a2818 [Pseudoalteromonas tunicata]AXT30845.1 H-NS histone family protein [Pseudoalteromonas tunicata]EAR29266.1 probable trans-acting regulatory HvrA protein [Pseudoalteromonas tunicata D2]MDP4982358.1 H-NS histone family protein [Pseudoalteromonas tunicata]MDP5213165.1 H-NS histone family protein [Pseudoalteromonas tunicata]